MLGKKVFIIDDEEDILEFLQFNLKKEGFTVFTFNNPKKALAHIDSNPPDVVVSDWLMPDMDGLEVCKTIKMESRWNHIPVIMITCKGDEIDIVTALELGADDYLVKPFGIKELAVRIKKILNKQNYALHGPLKQTPVYTEERQNHPKGLLINKETYTVFLDNEKLNLTYAEFKLLELLAEKPGKVFTRSQIIEHDYGNDYYVTERSVDVKIVGLRKKLGKYDKLIETIRSVGYRYNEPA
ncbi:MAG: response regulator transcription factor [Bacteroidetes bacterium]|nr:response regulator transcription factor [Bacteroidota bacterium]